MPKTFPMQFKLKVKISENSLKIRLRAVLLMTLPRLSLMNCFIHLLTFRLNAYEFENSSLRIFYSSRIDKPNGPLSLSVYSNSLYLVCSNYDQLILSTFDWIVGLYVMSNSLGASINASHELFHRQQIYCKIVSFVTLFFYQFTIYPIKRLYLHHKKVGTAEDSIKTPKNENIYYFINARSSVYKFNYEYRKTISIGYALHFSVYCSGDMDGNKGTKWLGQDNVLCFGTHQICIWDIYAKNCRRGKTKISGLKVRRIKSKEKNDKMVESVEVAQRVEEVKWEKSKGLFVALLSQFEVARHCHQLEHLTLVRSQ